MGLGKGRLVSRPTENAAFGRCRNYVSKLTREEVVDYYKRLYGDNWFSRMPDIAKDFIYENVKR